MSVKEIMIVKIMLLKTKVISLKKFFSRHLPQKVAKVKLRKNRRVKNKAAKISQVLPAPAP